MVVSKSFSNEQGVTDVVSADNVALLTKLGVLPPPAKRKTSGAEPVAYEQEKHKILIANKRKTLDKTVETLVL